jgi:plasmid maintenance system killer protein
VLSVFIPVLSVADCLGFDFRSLRLTSRVFVYRDTERFAAGGKVRQWEAIRQQAEKRLRILDAATSPGDLAALNSNRLETLKGGRKGQYSIRQDAGKNEVEISCDCGHPGCSLAA